MENTIKNINTLRSKNKFDYKKIDLRKIIKALKIVKKITFERNQAIVEEEELKKIFEKG